MINSLQRHRLPHHTLSSYPPLMNSLHHIHTFPIFTYYQSGSQQDRVREKLFCVFSPCFAGWHETKIFDFRLGEPRHPPTFFSLFRCTHRPGCLLCLGTLYGFFLLFLFLLFALLFANGAHLFRTPISPKCLSQKISLRF